MNQVQTTFQEPIAQPALEGALGLTSEHIAAALGVRHSNVLRAIREYIRMDSAFTHSEQKALTGGRSRKVFVMPVSDARVVVAQYKSKVGIAYVRYLINFEQNARIGEEHLRAAMDHLQQEVATLRSRLEATAKPRALPRPKTSLVTELVTCHDSLMGDGEVISRHLVRVPTSALTELEIKKAKRVMLVLQQEGIARAIRNLQDQIDFAEQPPTQRLRLTEKDSSTN